MIWMGDCGERVPEEAVYGVYMVVPELQFLLAGYHSSSLKRQSVVKYIVKVEMHEIGTSKMLQAQIDRPRA